jgi:hypothetical protein
MSDNMDILYYFFMCMTTNDILNSVGLFFDITGAVMTWWFVRSLWELDENGGIMSSDEDSDKRNKKYSKWGLFLLIVGFALQFLSNFVS